MKKFWKFTAAAAMGLLLVCLWMDIAFGAFSSPRRRMPVLMYHHFVDGVGEELPYTIVSSGRFREQMEALKAAGYTSVTLEQMIAFAEDGEPLPEKPVLITMDDGYTSNLEIAAPILEELGMCATVFVIGVYEGEQVDIHTGEPLQPARFSYEEASPWIEKGVLDVQCHTFDMHQTEPRCGVLPMKGESDEAYLLALQEDLQQFQMLRERRVSATPLVGLAYPYGKWSVKVDRLLAENGIAVTMTSEEHCSTLFARDMASLRLLGRYNVLNSMSGKSLAQKLDRLQ